MNPELPLRDIHLPEAISWWPPAPGWWLAIGICMLLVMMTVLIVRRWLRPNLKKEAAKALDAIEQSFQETEDATACVSELSAFLRRVVLSREQSDRAAGLTGEAWLKLLDSPLKSQEFSQGVGELLLTGPYQASVNKERVSQLIQLCRKWVNVL